MNPYLFNSAYLVNSPVHRLDPRTKFLAILPLGILCYTVSSFTGILTVSLFLVFCAITGKTAFSFIRKTVFAFFWLFFITFVLHVLFTDGRLLWTIPVINIRITEEGLTNGFFYSWRFFVLISFSFILLYTTPPVTFADGFLALIRPLRKFKVPVESISIMIGLVMRFIPMFYEEIIRIKRAQQARGAVFSGSPANRIKMILSLIMPVFISVFRKAEVTAVVLEARGYRPGQIKTSVEEPSFKVRDLIALLILIALTVFVIWLR